MSNDVAELLIEEEKVPWVFHLLRPPTKSAFRELAESIAPIGLFIHDSDHVYSWQRFELETAGPLLTPEGWLPPPTTSTFSG